MQPAARPSVSDAELTSASVLVCVCVCVCVWERQDHLNAVFVFRSELQSSSCCHVSGGQFWQRWAARRPYLTSSAPFIIRTTTMSGRLKIQLTCVSSLSAHLLQNTCRGTQAGNMTGLLWAAYKFFIFWNIQQNCGSSFPPMWHEHMNFLRVIMTT